MDGLEIIACTPDQLTASIKSETVKWAAVIKRARIKVDRPQTHRGTSMHIFYKYLILNNILFMAFFAVTAHAAAQNVLSVDRFVPHVATVPINKGHTVGLHVRERVLDSVAQKASNGAPAPVVLFLHGGFSPAPVAYDLNYKDYSWMEYLARAGFDVFALAHTAYGFSPKPGMDDPCNVVAEQQKILIPHVLKAPCAPRYPHKMVSSQSEWDEIESAVKYILQLRGVKKVSLVGWSTGTPRIGGFAAKYSEVA